MNDEMREKWIANTAELYINQLHVDIGLATRMAVRELEDLEEIYKYKDPLGKYGSANELIMTILGGK